jgi:hypothetical protein
MISDGNGASTSFSREKKMKTINLRMLFGAAAPDVEIDVYLSEVIRTLLEENRQIAHVWAIGDVQDVRPDLTDDQCWHVLVDVDRHKDASVGITWDTLEVSAFYLFGAAPERADDDADDDDDDDE